MTLTETGSSDGFKRESFHQVMHISWFTQTVHSLKQILGQLAKQLNWLSSVECRVGYHSLSLPVRSIQKDKIRSIGEFGIECIFFAFKYIKLGKQIYAIFTISNMQLVNISLLFVCVYPVLKILSWQPQDLQRESQIQNGLVSVEKEHVSLICPDIPLNCITTYKPLLDSESMSGRDHRWARSQ